MDGKKKLEELVASIKGHPDLTTRFISAGDIRAIRRTVLKETDNGD